MLAAERIETRPDSPLAVRLAEATSWRERLRQSWPGARWVTSLPAQEYLTRASRLPPARNRQVMKDLVGFEVDHELGLGESGYCFGYELLEMNRKEASALIAVARRETVNLAAEWGSGPARFQPRISIGPVALRELLNAGPRIRNRRKSGVPQNCITLGIARDQLQILTARSGIVGSLRMISLPPDLTESESLDLVLRHARRALQALRAADSSESPRSASIYTDSAPDERLKRKIEEALPLQVVFLDPWSSFEVSQMARAIPPEERGAFACATGLALAGFRSSSLDLWERPTTSRWKPYATQIRRAVAPAAVAVSLLLGLAYSPHSPWRITRDMERQHAYARTLLSNLRRASASESTGRYPRVQDMAGLAEETRRDASFGPELLRELSERLPKAASISELSFDQGKAVTFRGVVTNHEMLAQLITATRAIPLFLDVQLTSARTSTSRQGDSGIEFQMAARIGAATQ